MTRAWRIPSHDTNKAHWIYFAPDTADRCIPLLAKARLVVLPLVQGEHGLLEVHVPQGNRGLVAEAHRACRSGQPLRDAKNAVLARSANEAAPKGVATAPANATNRMMQFVTDYL